MNGFRQQVIKLSVQLVRRRRPTLVLTAILPCFLNKCWLNNLANPPSLLFADPPKFLKEVKKEYEVLSGSTVKLKCVVNGVDDLPPDEMTLTAWQKIDANGTHTITKAWQRFKMKLGKHLKISDVRVEDSGTYICIARNPYGKNQESIKLTVQGKCC